MTEFDKLLRAVMDAAYDTGYYSGKHEDGQLHHQEAIAERCRAKQALLARVKALVDTLREMEEADIWGRSLGYSVCNMCGVKAIAGERFVHKDGCPYGVLIPFREAPHK